MTTKEYLDEILEGLPEDRLNELLQFARFLSSQEERDGWREFGRNQLARVYGPDEPEYTLEDIKPEVNS